MEHTVILLDDVEIRHNSSVHRFEAWYQGQPIGEIDYDPEGDTLVFLHTGVRDVYTGQGVAEKLTRVAFETAEAAGQRIEPLCPYTQAFVRRNPDYKRVLRRHA
jgi:predicted GNAT family acetyltransferase